MSKRGLLLKAVGFAAIALGLVAAAGPIVGMATAVTGLSRGPAAAYGAVVSALLLAATGLALHLEGLDLRSLGLVPTQGRIRELVVGFAAGVVLFVILALVRGALAGVTWTFGGLQATLPVLASLLVALLLLLPEELLPRVCLSAIDSGSRGLAGNPHLGGALRPVSPRGFRDVGHRRLLSCGHARARGVVFGWLAVRTRGLALPIGLHLGGNWVQAAVFSFRAGPDTGPTAAAWTAYVTESQQWALYGPDLASHWPFIVTMFLAVVILRLTPVPR